MFVFAFFGLVATVGSTYVHQQRMPGLAWLAAVAVGFLACSLLVINNLRDRLGDEKAGKRTLAVRLGDRRTRLLYVALLDGSLIMGSLCALFRPWAVLVLVAGLITGPPVRSVLAGAEGPDLVDVLAQTGKIQTTAVVLLALGLALSA